MTTHLKNIAGREIQRLRIARHWSQNDLAAACQVTGWDISRGTLAKIEAGVRCVSDMEVVMLAKVIGTAPSDLLKRDFKACLKLNQSLRS